jgi:hypothetical protein
MPYTCALPGDLAAEVRCSRRVPPLLMKVMNEAEFGSTGAALTSVFHQLSAGNSGSGPGSAPPWTGPIPAACAGDDGDDTSNSPATMAASWIRSDPWGAIELSSGPP